MNLQSRDEGWDDERGRWCPSIHTEKFHGTKEERAELKKKLSKSSATMVSEVK